MPIPGILSRGITSSGEIEKCLDLGKGTFETIKKKLGGRAKNLVPIYTL